MENFACQRICECGGICDECVEEESVKQQVEEDTCLAHGIFCCALCFDMESYLWDYVPERK